MKHTLQITLVIIVMFLITQFIGLFVINSYNNYFGKAAEQKIETGQLVQPEVSIVQETIPPKAELKEPIDIAGIIMSIVISLIIAVLLFFFLSKIKVTSLIKVWFTFVVFICLAISFSLFLYPIFSSSNLSNSLFTIFGKKVALAELIALPLAAILTFYKIVKRNIFVHNFTELFIYPGIAIIFLPLLNIIAASILLVIISIYDMWAVWKTKHMIKLAKFQMDKLKIFTGFFVPYIKTKDKKKIIKIQRMIAMEKRKKKRNKGKKSRKKSKKFKNIKVNIQVAALGGGDVAFPLIFAGTIFLRFGLFPAIITILSTTLALSLLLTFSKKGRFYPAMPFLSGGCFLGLILTLIFFA